MLHSPYTYLLGPWRWDADAPGWGPPPDCVASLDLGTPADMAAPGSDRPIGFFACTTAPADSAYTLLGTGDCREIAATAAMQSALHSVLGLPADPQGDTLVDLLWDCLTTQSDPEGQARVAPLVPTVAGRLELWLPGHSCVKAERFVWGKHPHTQILQAKLRGQFAEQWKAAGTRADAPGARDQVRRVLDAACGKYRLTSVDAWRQLIADADQADVGGRRKHATSVSDDFNRSDAELDASGSGWSVPGGGDVRVISNQAGPYASIASNTGGACRYDTDLSSDDMTSQATIAAGGSTRLLGTLCRFSAGALTWYMTMAHDTFRNLRKCVAGTYTTLASDTTGSDVGVAIRCRADGSSIAFEEDGATVLTATDTGVTGHVRAGMYFRGSDTTERLDAWTAADITAASLVIPAAMHQYRMRR